LNFKKWPVTASGGGAGVVRGGGGRFYKYVREIAIEIRIFDNYYLIHAFWWKLRAFRAGESEVTCGQWILKLMLGYINSKTTNQIYVLSISSLYIFHF
jgi:hypothetical protein